MTYVIRLLSRTDPTAKLACLNVFTSVAKADRKISMILS